MLYLVSSKSGFLWTFTCVGGAAFVLSVICDSKNLAFKWMWPQTYLHTYYSWRNFGHLGELVLCIWQVRAFHLGLLEALHIWGTQLKPGMVRASGLGLCRGKPGLAKQPTVCLYTLQAQRMARDILGLLHVTKEKLDHLYISFDRAAEGATVHCGQWAGPTSSWRSWCSGHPRRILQPKRCHQAVEARDSSGVVGVERPGRVPMGTTLDSSPKLCLYKTSQ